MDPGRDREASGGRGAGAGADLSGAGAIRVGAAFDAGELARGLVRSRGLPLNFASGQQMTPERGWNHVYSSSILPGAAFERAREAMTRMEFSDPRIVVPHFDPDEPLEGRHILLELKAAGVRLLAPVRVGQVREEDSPQGTLFAFSLETLSGHIERGREWFTLFKDATSGEVSFGIDAVWQAGDFPTWWSYLGFQLLGRRYQRAWHRLAHERMARIAHGDAFEKPAPVQLSAVRALRPPGVTFESERLRRDRLLLAATFGGLSGARTAAGPALVAWGAGAPRSVRAAAAGFAAFEMVADSMPFIGDRVSPSQITGRAIAGAVAGGALAGRSGRRRLGPALVGAASAVAAAGVTFLLRRACARRMGFLAGIAEDAAVYGLGALAVSRMRRGDQKI